jgi:hypothetical protein
MVVYARSSSEMEHWRYEMKLCGRVVVLGLSTLLWGSFAHAQCTKDTDCKGDRICRKGACEDPVPITPASPSAVSQSVAPPIVPSAATAAGMVAASPSPPGPASSRAQDLRGLGSLSAYASVAGLADFHSWGDDRVKGVGFGGYAAGYWAPNPLFHLGGFFHASKFHGFNDGHFGLGASIKGGGCPSDLVWMGIAVDFGFHIANGYKGVETFPRFETDLQVGQNGRFRTALFASFGPMIARGGGGDYFASLQMLAGLMVGG